MRIGDPSLATVDNDTANLVSLSATLVAPHAGDVLLANTSGTSISASFTGSSLLLSGSDSLDHYRQVLRTVSYNNTSGGPGVGSLTIQITAHDGVTASLPATSTITIDLAAAPSPAIFSKTSAYGFTTVGRFTYFAASDPAHGTELWRTDGTPAGTTLVKDIVGGIASSYPSWLTSLSGTLLFIVNGHQLWKSDGTEFGTLMLTDLYSPGVEPNPQQFTVAENKLFFTIYETDFGRELWKTDGTQAGTSRVKDIRLGDVGSSIEELTNVNGTLYFRANDGTTGSELWKSDGTTAGTIPVEDIRSGPADGYPSYLTNVNGVLYFRANDGQAGPELWRSEGTAANTFLVKDIAPTFFNVGSTPGNLTNVNGTLYFTAIDELHRQELWKSDGTFALEHLW